MSKVQVLVLARCLLVTGAFLSLLPTASLAQTTSGESRLLPSGFSICVVNGSAFNLAVQWEEYGTGVMFASRTVRKGEESCQTPGSLNSHPPYRVKILFQEAGVMPASCRSIIRTSGKSTLRAFGATGPAAGCLGTGY